MQNITNDQIITFCEQRLQVKPDEVKTKLLDMFTMSTEQLESAIATRSNAVTYEVAISLIENIIGNSEKSEDLNAVDRLAWMVRCAYLSGFEEATTFFNECSIASVQELCGSVSQRHAPNDQVMADAAQK